MQAYKFARGELRTLLQGRSISIHSLPHKPKTLTLYVTPSRDMYQAHNIEYYESVINATTGAACVREALQLSLLSKANITLELTTK